MSDTNNQLGAERSIIALGAKGIQLTNFEELFRFATFVHKAGFAPRGMESPEKIFLAVQMGLEIGISPMMALQNAAVINGRPGFYGELVVAIVQAHPTFEDMIIDYDGEGDDYGCTVTIKRKGRTPSTGSFTIGQAKKADLLNNPAKKDTWGKYTDDMLMWRAFSRAKRVFSDVLRGFRTVEDLRDQPEEREVTGRTVEPNFDGDNPPTGSLSVAGNPVPNILPPRRARAPKQEIPPDLIPPDKALEKLAELKKAVKPTADYPEPDPAAEVMLRLKEEQIPQDDFLNLLAQLDLIVTDPSAIEMGHFTIGHVPQETLQMALKDWPNVVKQLRAVAS